MHIVNGEALAIPDERQQPSLRQPDIDVAFHARSCHLRPQKYVGKRQYESPANAK